MKTKIISSLFVVLPIFSFAQISSSIDLIAGIEYSYRNLTVAPNVIDLITTIDSRNNREEEKLNWRFGFNYNKRLSSNLFLKTGIRLASVGYADEKRTDLRWPSEIGPNGYVFDPTLPHEMQLIYDYWFLEIPLIGRYEFSNKKFSPFVEAGISPSYYLTTKTKTITDLDTNTTSQRGGNGSYSNLHLVGVIAVGANYSINEKFQLFGQGTYRRHFTKLVDAPIRGYLYNYGFEFGVRRKIN